MCSAFGFVGFSCFSLSFHRPFPLIDADWPMKEQRHLPYFLATRSTFQKANPPMDNPTVIDNIPIKLDFLKAN